MNTIKAVSGAVQGDAVFMRRDSGWLTIFWIVMTPVSYMLGAQDAV
jgi:hypothetical protein